MVAGPYEKELIGPAFIYAPASMTGCAQTGRAVLP
jgi:hypothetical protein